MTIMTTESENSDECEPPPVKRHRGEDKLMNILDDVINAAPHNKQDSSVKAKAELARYIGDDCTNTNPLPLRGIPLSASWHLNIYAYQLPLSLLRGL